MENVISKENNNEINDQTSKEDELNKIVSLKNYF